jgi:hypothetical protein
VSAPRIESELAAPDETPAYLVRARILSGTSTTSIMATAMNAALRANLGSVTLAESAAGFGSLGSNQPPQKTGASTIPLPLRANRLGSSL